MNKGRKITGGKYHSNRKKRLNEKQSQEIHSFLGETRTKRVRTRGGNSRHVLLRGDSANLLIKGKVKKVKISNITETPQNKFLARQNRIMKGVIIETELGKAKVTNRPTREGFINAVLVDN